MLSNALPAVSKTAVPEAGAGAGAVQRYQTEAPPRLPAWFGSRGSFAAPSFRPVTEPAPPSTACAAAKSSFAGARARRLEAPALAGDRLRGGEAVVCGREKALPRQADRLRLVGHVRGERDRVDGARLRHEPGPDGAQSGQRRAGEDADRLREAAL